MDYITIQHDQYQQRESKALIEADIFERRCQQIEKDLLESGSIPTSEGYSIEELIIDDADHFGTVMALIVNARSIIALREYQRLLRNQVHAKLPDYARLCAEHEQEKKTGPIYGVDQ